MKKVTEIIRKDRLYVLLLIFIMLINITVLVSVDKKGDAGKVSSAAAKTEWKKARTVGEALLLERRDMEGTLYKNKPLAMLFMLTSLLMLAVLFLGLLIDVVLISFKLAKKNLELSTYRLEDRRWNIWDVGKVVLLFLFFGYVIIIIESLLAGTFSILKNDNVRMILNTSILDLVGAIFILHFTVGQYKEKLISLGISFKNFFKNVFYGVVGYIAIVPILVGLLIITAVVIKLINYVPERQPVVELFLKEEGTAFLAYTSVFASILGPIIEELFFRGFMYNAFKKSIGVLGSTLFTAAVFAALHTNIVGFLPIMALGMLLAYLYEKTGTLISSITVHTCHNLSMVLFVFLIRQIRV